MSTITRLFPYSYSKLELAILHAIETRGAVAPEDMAITPEVSAHMDTFAPIFCPAITNMHKTLGLQVEKTAEKNKYMTILINYEISFIKHLNNCIEISELNGDDIFKPSDREYYYISSSQDTLPKITTEAEAMIWGKQIMEGEQRRIADGKPALTQPSMAEIYTWFQLFRTANNEQTALKNAYDHSLQALADLKPEAIALVKDIWDDAENFYRHQEPESKRRLCREWGVTYITRENKKSCDVTGTVKDPSGMPLENVRVELKELGRFEDTTIDGTYEFTDIPEGKYTFRFIKTSYPTIVKSDVDIIFDQPNVLDAVMEFEVLEE